MLKMVDGTGIIGVDMVCPLGGAVSPPQPPNYDKIEVEGVGSLMLPNSLKAPLERIELIGNSVQGENPAPDNLQEIRSAGRFDEASGKYLIDVEISSNLFDISKVQNTPQLINNGDGTLTLTSKSSSGKTMLKEICPDLIVGGTYTLKFDTDGINYIYCGGIWSSESSKQITQAMLDSIVYFYNNNNQPVVTIKNIQINRGAKVVPYSQYRIPQSVQIALDEPLRGIGEYKDTITKDGVVRKIKQITVNEKSNLIFYTESKNTFGYLVKVPDATQTNYTYSVISDRFVKTQYIDSNDTNGVVTLFGKQIMFRVSKEIANNIDTLKEWLVANNITFNYVLESPVTEPLPESVQAQLQALHSYNGTTHINIDSGEVECGIKLTYRKEI